MFLRHLKISSQLFSSELDVFPIDGLTGFDLDQDHFPASQLVLAVLEVAGLNSILFVLRKTQVLNAKRVHSSQGFDVIQNR